MRTNLAGLLAATALIGIGCGGSGGGNQPVMTPTAPSVPNAQPPTVNVSTPGEGWNGQSSSDQGSGPFSLIVTQAGSQFTGTIGMIGHSGVVAGTVSGNTVTFNFSQIGNQTQPCGALSATAVVTSVNTMTSVPNTTNSMTGTFSGTDCAGKSITNGTFTGALTTNNSATRFPFAGTWKGGVPPALGGGAWTWTIAQSGDINSGTLGGTVTISPDPLNFGVGAITGTFNNVFPGPPNWGSAVTTVSFAGACPATLNITWGNLTSMMLSPFSPDGLQLIATTFSGSSCSGSIPGFKPDLKRQ